MLIPDAKSWSGILLFNKLVLYMLLTTPHAMSYVGQMTLLLFIIIKPTTTIIITVTPP